MRLLLLAVGLLAALAAATADVSLAAAPVFRSTPPTFATPPRPQFRVVVVNDLTTADLGALAARGAVGLLVPGVGSLTDRRNALQALERGADTNPYLNRASRHRALLHVLETDTVPSPSGVIVLSLPPAGPLQSNERRYPIAVLGGGYHGLLTSQTTRIPGLVSIVDVAPTALGRVRGALGWTANADPLPQLERLDVQIGANNRLKMPTVVIVAVAIVLLALALPSGGVAATVAALATNLLAGASHLANEPLLVALMIAGTLAGGLALARICSSEERLLAAILAMLALYLLLMVVHPDWVAITPLGPTQNSRFWGIGNQLETLLLAPVIAGAAVATRRFGLAGFAAFALLALVLVTDNRFGSDGGGAIVFGVALAYVGARTLRLGLRGFLTLLAADAAVVLSIVLLNLRLPGPDHLRSAFSRGLPGLAAVAANRVPLAYLPALHQWPLLLPLGLAAAVVFAAAVRRAPQPARDLVLGAGLALVVSLLVNDSGTYELAAGTGVIAALARTRTPTIQLRA